MRRGGFLHNIELPGIGSVSGFSGKHDDNETFYTFTSFTYPPTIFKYDIKNNKSSTFRQPAVKFKPAGYETTQIFLSKQ